MNKELIHLCEIAQGLVDPQWEIHLITKHKNQHWEMNKKKMANNTKNDQNSSVHVSNENERKSEKPNKIEMQGEVIESLPAALFKIQINPGNAIVLATLAGKLRQNRIRILPGDHVLVEVSAYDTSRGRILYRF